MFAVDRFFSKPGTPFDIDGSKSSFPQEVPLTHDLVVQILFHVSPDRGYAQTCKYFYEIHKKITVLFAMNLLKEVDRSLLHIFQIPQIDKQSPYDSSVQIMKLFRQKITSALKFLSEKKKDPFLGVSLSSMLATPKELNKLLRAYEEGMLARIRKVLFPLSELGYIYEILKVTRLERLDVLKLDRAQILWLPAVYSCLFALQGLYLEGNQLTSVPEKLFKRLTALKALRLSNNQLSSLSAEISNLSKLIFLYIDNNSLTSLPEEIGALTELQNLDLSNNQLTRLPESLVMLKKLRWLDVRGNRQLVNHSPSISILAFLRENGCNVIL